MTPRPFDHNVPPAAPHRTAWLLVLFVLVAVALRWPLMGDSLWFDEACMSNQRVGTWEQLLATVYVDIHPPLYVVFMHFWNGWFGDGELSMRLPPLVTGLASIPLLYLAGRRLVGHRAALWAALLLVLSPAHIWYSAEARLYSPMVFCALLLVWTFDRLVEDERPPRWVWLLHIANAAVMLALHYYLALYVVLLAVLAPLTTKSLTGRAGRLLLWHGGLILLLGAFLVAKRALGHFETSQGYLGAMTPGKLYDLLFRWCATGNTLRPAPSVLAKAADVLQQILYVGLSSLGLVAVWRARAQRPRGPFVPLYALVIPGFLFACAGIGLDSTYIERSCLPCLPFLLLMVGAGLDLLPRAPYRIAAGLLLALSVAAVVGLFSYRKTDWTVYKPNPDWRSAAAWLGHEIDRGGGGRPVYTSMPNPRPLPYYDERIQDVKTLRPATDPDEIGRQVAARIGAYFGELAASTFRAFDAHNRELLENAALRVYPSHGDPDELDLASRGRDDVCYLVRNEWHPHRSVDHSIEDLLRDPRVEVLDEMHSTGISVYEVRILP